MNKLIEARQAWPGKSDEWLYERISEELTQKTNEMRRILKCLAMYKANSSDVLGDGWRDARKEKPDDGVIVLNEDCDKVHYYKDKHYRYSRNDCWFMLVEDGCIAIDVKAWRPLPDPPNFS